MMRFLSDRTPVLLDLGFSESQIPKLRTYIQLLWDSNQELNLISRKMTFEELIDNHVVDCLLPLKHFPSDVTSVGDFGSGGGLPGIIYALQFPKIKFHLFEKSPLKGQFLEACRRLAPNIEIHRDIPTQLEGIDLIVARGFKPLDVILEMSRDYHAKNGRYFLLKARREKIDEELGLAKKKFKALEVKIIPLASPVLEVERHLLVIEPGH